jgi:hypothetical protein
MINGWPERGDTVVWTAGLRPVPLRVADSLIVEAGAFAYVKAYLAGSSRPGTYFIRHGDIVAFDRCCPTCYGSQKCYRTGVYRNAAGTWAPCACNNSRQLATAASVTRAPGQAPPGGAALPLAAHQVA